MNLQLDCLKIQIFCSRIVVRKTKIFIEAVDKTENVFEMSAL